MSGFSVSLVAFTKFSVSSSSVCRSSGRKIKHDEPWSPGAGRVDELLVLGSDDPATPVHERPQHRERERQSSAAPSERLPLRRAASSVSRNDEQRLDDRERAGGDCDHGQHPGAEAILDEVRAELADVERERGDVETDEEEQGQDERRQQVDAL